MKEVSMGDALPLWPLSCRLAGNGFMFVFLHPAHRDERGFAALHKLGCDVLLPVRPQILQPGSQ